MMSQCVLVSKSALYLVVMLYVQGFLLSNAGDGLTWLDKFKDKEWIGELNDHRPIVLWLIFETICFYASILSLVVLILISKVREFTPIRDRVNLSSYHKSKIDFLLYRFDDLHWFIVIFQQISFYAVNLV